MYLFLFAGNKKYASKRSLVGIYPPKTTKIVHAMHLKTYKKLHKKYSEFPLPKEVWDTPEHQAYTDAFHNDKDCQSWELKQRVKKAGINFKKYCCIDMAYQLIEDKNAMKTGTINYDSVITQDRKGKAFGLPIHDGGSSFIKIKFCPWCGKKLT
jgi:hypothetical protein